MGVAPPLPRVSAPGIGIALALGVAATAGCAEKFTLPPVPDAEIPETGAYNLDRVWHDMGEIEDMIFGGGSLYTLTRRKGEPRVEVWLPGAGNPTPSPPISAGQPIEGLRRPVALARFNESLATFVYVADDRGPDLLESTIGCPLDAGGCFFALSAPPGGAGRAILARPFEPIVSDFVLSARARAPVLAAGGVIWMVLGTAPGRLGIWLEIDDAALVRPVRSDGAFPIPELPFDAESWHEIRITYHDEDEEYDVTIDGVTLDDAIPTFHPVNAPVEVLGARIAGGTGTLELDDVVITPAGGAPVALSLDFEDPDDGEGWIDGPYFVNDPPPAVLRYLTSPDGTSLEATLTDPAWIGLHGIAVGRDRTLYVSAEEQDPEDPTGVLKRSQIHRFSSTGERLAAIAEPGTGLGFVTQPRDLAFDGEHLLVVDEALNRVQKLDPDTPNTAVFQIPPLEAKDPWFAGPTDVVTDVGRSIYVADTRNHRVLRYTPEGAFADTVYSPTYGPTSAAGDIALPAAIAATDTTVLVADRVARRIVFLKRAGEISGGGERDVASRSR